MSMTQTSEEQFKTQVDAWVERIKNWNCEDVYELMDIIHDYPKVSDVENAAELQHYSETKFESISSDLPVAKEYEERVMKHSSYPIWTCDRKGQCLVGTTADAVVSIECIENK